MKTKQLLSVAFLCAVAAYANASPNVGLHSPYVGLDVIKTNQDFKQNFGKKWFKKNPINYAVFAGVKFSQHFGLELGHERQPGKSKKVALVPTDFSPGGPALAEFAVIESSLKARHTYAAFLGEVSLSSKVKFKALIGASISHIAARSAFLSIGGNSLSQQNYNATVRHYSKTKVVPMLQVSLNYLVTDNIGLKLSGNYRNMSRFKVYSKERADAGFGDKIKMKDTYGAGIGLVYSF